MNFANQIVEKQNQQRQLELLLVQRHLYSGAKKIFAWRTFIALIFAILGPVLVGRNDSSAAYLGLAAFFYLLINDLVLERLELSKKRNAAKVQEAFDDYVLDLSWNEVVTGGQLHMEVVDNILSKSFKKDFSTLKNWYAVDIARVDLDFGRFLCQRSNTWWDSKLRNRYLILLILSVLIIGVILLSYSISSNLTVAKLLSGIIFPSLPLIELILKQIIDHFEVAGRIKILTKSLDNFIDKMTGGELINDAKSIARTFQDEIFRHRENCPMIYDWVYWFFRDKQENQMQFTIERKVNDFLDKASRST